MSRELSPREHWAQAETAARRTRLEDLLAWHITGTEIFEISTADRTQLLGQVRWFPRWRKYSFFPRPDRVFESSCLRDIADFCERETLERESLTLTSRETLVLEARDRGESRESIGQRYKVSGGRIRQIEAKARCKVKIALQRAARP